MLGKTIIAAVAVLVVAGCASEPPVAKPAPQSTKTLEPAKGDQRATASSQELQVNPNGTLTDPGSKLGGK
jgi:hypothetical protein